MQKQYASEFLQASKIGAKVQKSLRKVLRASFGFLDFVVLMISNTLRQLYRHRQEVFVVFPSALDSLYDFLEVFLIRDSDLLARLNKGVIDGCICCPLSRCDRRGVFRFAAAGVFVAAKCQKFLK